MEVVLATCNGEAHLEAQLQSVWDQQRRPDHLLVFDDRSSDGTMDILQQWALRQPGWLELLPSQPQRLGPRDAFNHLLQATTAPYVALCDQDDIWLPQRLSRGLKLLQREEQRRGVDAALLLHSDAELINAQEESLGQTLWQWLGIRDQQPSPLHLALRNVVSGCTMLVNRALLDQALPIPPQAVMHDHWLALIAQQQQGLIACAQPLIRHRRHGGNASGPMADWPSQLLRALAKLRQWQAFRARSH
jgi:glycosyltransferase involved in cell wall biosynthesis